MIRVTVEVKVVTSVLEVTVTSSEVCEVSIGCADAMVIDDSTDWLCVLSTVSSLTGSDWLEVED